MSSSVISHSTAWNVGESVKAYLQSDWAPHELPPSGAPSGVQQGATGTVGSRPTSPPWAVTDGQAVTITGLDPNESYFLYGLTSGHYEAVRTGPAVEVTVDELQELEAALAALQPAGTAAETLNRAQVANVTSFLSSGRLQLTAVPLKKGDVINSATIFAGTTAGATLTHSWACLLDAAGNVLGLSADITTAAWTANTSRTFAFASSIEIEESGLYYIGLCVVGTTVPTLLGATSHANLTDDTPVLAATADTGLTDPASLGTVGALTAVANSFYARLSS